MPQFGVDFIGAGDGFRDFLAEQFPEAFAQAVDGHAQRAFVLPEFFGEFDIRNRVAVGGEENFQLVEFVRPAAANSSRRRVMVCSISVKAQRRS